MYFRFCMLLGPYLRPCTTECSNGWWSVSTRPWTLSCQDSSSLESWILLGLKSLMWVLMWGLVGRHKRCQEIALGWVFLFLNEQKAKCWESHKGNNVYDFTYLGFFSLIDIKTTCLDMPIAPGNNISYALGYKQFPSCCSAKLTAMKMFFFFSLPAV